MWFWHRLIGDFWPVDKASIAPNITAAVICAVPAYFIGIRRGIRKFHAKLDSLHEKQDRLHAHLGVPEAEHV